MTHGKYIRTVQVLPSQASALGVIKLRSLIDLFQDTASMAVETLEGSNTDLLSRGYTWILRRYEVNFLGPLPALDEKFTIQTFHDPSHGHNMLRVFEVTRPNGDLLVWAKTAWLLMDLATSRPVRPSEHIPEIFELYTGEIASDFRDIPRIGEAGTMVPWNVRAHDLDVNGHVNNAAYFEWFYEATLQANVISHSFSSSSIPDWQLKAISGMFRSSVRYGDPVKIQINDQSESDSSNERTLIYRVLPGGKPGPEFMCTWQLNE